jgi:hypothetical protein
MATTTTKARAKHPAAVMLGALGGRPSKRTPAQTAAARRNIKRAIAARWAKKKRKAAR